MAPASVILFNHDEGAAGPSQLGTGDSTNFELRLSGTDASGTTYTYDNMDRIATKATPQGTLSYSYDAAGHVASIASSNANGASMSYSYDSLNRLSTVADNRLNGRTTTYSYDNASNVATVTYPNGVQTVFSYDVTVATARGAVLAGRDGPSLWLRDGQRVG